MKAASLSNELYFLAGGGDMGELLRSKDWTQTALGDPRYWPPSLKSMVAMMLNNPFGMYIAWGEDYIQLYNDAYRPILGSSKHPAAVGIGTRETFSEIWHIIGSMFDGVMKGEPVGFTDFMLPLNRNGFVEECYFDFSYSPIFKENGEVGGVLVTVIETTQKKKAIDAVKESEARFRTLADNITQLAWMTDEEGSRIWYNQRWLDYTGTTLEEMKGWGWQAVHHPDFVDSVVKKFSLAIERQEEWEDTFPLRGADGKYRWFLSRAVPVKDHKGEVIRWFGTNTDITELMESEQALKESETRFRTMAEGTDVLIAISDETSNATYFNKNWTELTGRSVDELLNYGWSDLIHIEDRDKFIDLYLQAFKNKEAWTGEFRIISKDGVYRWLLAKGTARFRPDGSFAGYISSSVDINDRKEAERRVRESEQNLRNTILQAPVAMCFFRGPLHVVELANESMFELMGKTAAEVVNRPIFEGLPEAKDQGFEKLLDDVFTLGDSVSMNGIPVTLPRNGKIETVYINFVYTPHRESDGVISGIMAVAVDVTPQILAQQKIEEVVTARTKELAEANQSLQRSNSELAQFAYIASHDLQEPLRKVTTFAQMLENSLGELNERSRSYLDKINSSAARMLTLIRDVLAYSQLSRDNDIYEMTDLNKIIDVIRTDFELLIEQKNARIEYKDLPSIEAIPLQMSQLFANLISNALKFASTDEQPVIEITSRVMTRDEADKYPLPFGDTAYYVISCRDNGIGFKQEYAKQIFHIFQRLHDKVHYSGTGIGLAMCKKIVQNHHGEIFATSEPGKYTVFDVILPVKQQPA